MIALARNATWLDDAQVQSVFHRLRHDPPPGLREGQAQGWDRESMIDGVFSRAVREIDANPTLRPQRRQGLRNRLTQSRSSTGMLPDDSLSALVRLQAGVQQAQAATERRLLIIAGQRGMSLREARAEFVQLRAEAPQGRQRRANADELRDLGAMPSDPATRYAVATMEARPPVHPPIRLVQQWLPVDGHSQISHIGMSDLSNRVEVRAHDGTVSAVSDVPRDEVVAVQEQGSSPVTAEAADRLVRYGRPLPDDRVDATGYAVRCDFCGRFTGDRGHDCPARNARVITAATEIHTDGASDLDMPPLAAIRDAMALRQGPVVLGVSYTSTGAMVDGSVIARPGLDVITNIDRLTRQRIDIDDAAPDLRCASCQSNSCQHTADAIRQIRHQLARGGRIARNAAARAERQEQLHARIQVADRTPPPAEPADASPAVSFLSNPEAFRAVIQSAGPERQVPFMPEHACAGLAANTRFGVELEFNGDTYATRDAVAERLRIAGLIRRSGYGGYHTASSRGYPAGEYSLENDASVDYGGELVTCIESDHPDSWNRIRQACEAIRGGGGTTHYAGSHTNISSDGFDPHHGWRLAHLVRAHEDDLLRMGRTPNSRRERGYNERLPHPGRAWDQIYSYGNVGLHRTSMVNFTRAFNRTSPRIEFRFPDASHDPGVIQGQVKLCAALTNYVRTNDVTPDQHRPAGTAHQEGWPNRLMSSSPQEWSDRTQGVRWLIDTLFTREHDRVQQAILWARGRYQRS